MNKVEVFHGISLPIIQYEVDSFAEKHKIINASICTEQQGYNVYYTILVVYEE